MTTTFCDLKCCEDRHGQTQPDTGRQRQSQTDTNRDRQTETDRDRHRQRQADRDRQRQTQADTEPARTLVAFQTRFPFFLSQVPKIRVFAWEVPHKMSSGGALKVVNDGKCSEGDWTLCSSPSMLLGDEVQEEGDGGVFVSAEAGG